ncbi:hypothetical protein [Peribacillus frigoritolerans]|uniref:hypothetical protein n=1 Tax=Peribacillus frigoritolerans TaxID=450367 RepID=UPI0006AC8C2B|nr:hypothetical protein [Peribacillus frigoritolerans]KOR78791.1 hypothetical protein AM232_10180 [Bacillus sp. FJAT-21352]MED4691996.1 hypothetical protein [Peribacillus frigoritolerans]
MLAILIVSFLMPIKQANAQGNDGRTFVPLEISSETFIPLTDEELEEIRNNDEYTVELTYDQAVERTSEITGDSIEDIKKEKSKYLFKGCKKSWYKCENIGGSNSNCDMYMD